MHSPTHRQPSYSISRGDGAGRRRGRCWCTMQRGNGFNESRKQERRDTMTDDAIDPPTTSTAPAPDDAAGDDEAVEDAGDLGAASSPPGDENASDDTQGIVGEEA